MNQPVSQLSSFDLPHTDRALRSIASAITAPAAPGQDATGGHVSCLTEALMGLTAAHIAIRNELSRIADVLEQRERARQWS